MRRPGLRHRLRVHQGRGLNPLPPRPPPKRLRLVVHPAEAGRSVRALLETRGGLSPETVDAALARGGVSVNRHRVASPDHPLAARDVLEAHLVERGRAPEGPPALDRDRILHLDADLVVVDKPPFVAAQGTLSDAAAGLDQAVSRLLASLGERHRTVGLVHRLDLETSGVTVFGRHPAAVRALSLQFRDGRVEKRYRALAQGLPGFDAATCDQPLGGDPNRPGLQCVSPRGRPASTAFRTLRRFDGPGAALLEARPATGRTHQIRVHALSLGHPLLGDRRYGGPALLTTPAGRRLLAPRVALHALSISFSHPTGRACTFEAPWPADLHAIEQALASEPAPG
jgi:23S rRNA pseudouridine1911/1915/1917 synthase